MPLKMQRSLKFESVQLTCIIVRDGAREKRKGHQLTGRYSKTWEWWVLFQTNRSKQGRLVRHLPPLKGTTCLLLFHLPASPGTLSEDLNVTIYILFLCPVLSYPLTLVRIQHTTCIRNYWRYLPSTHDKVINSVLDSCWYNVQLTIIALLFVRFLLIFLSSFY